VLFLVFVLSIGTVGFCSESSSQEHPTMILTGEHPSEHPKTSEHPTEHPKNVKEHPRRSKEHPSKGKEHLSEHPKKVKEIKINDLAKEIKKYVDKDTKLKGGYFMVYDNKANKTLLLKLKKIHKDKLAKVSRDTYFACADFEDPKGKIYDIDIFMQDKHRDHMTVTEVSIHKEAGKPRYTWHEKNGVWRKQKVK
jgi:hypothetical protein